MPAPPIHDSAFVDGGFVARGGRYSFDMPTSPARRCAS